MSACPCGITAGSARDVGTDPTNSRDGGRPHAVARRGLRLAGWLVPGTILAISPKCPLCLAAYIAAVTGVGISLSMATSLRILLSTLCVTSLAIVAATALRRVVTSARTVLGPRNLS